MSKKKSEAEAPGAGAPGFEKALARLETIVQEMEGGRLSLEEMLTRFEEGQALVKICAEKLEQVERRIETLVKVGGTLTTKPFDEEEPASESGGEAPSGDKADGLPF